MSKIKIGILGLASIAERFMIGAIKKSDNLELIGIASKKDSNLERIKKEYKVEAFNNYQALLDMPDMQAVYIPLPNSMHYKWINNSLKKGLHVLCEKSLCENYDDAEIVVAIARENGILLKENFQFEYHPQINIVKSILQKEEIGEIRLMRSSFGFPPFKDTDNIRNKKELGGGALLDAGAYPIKATKIFLGDGLKFQSGTLFIDQKYGVDTRGAGSLISESGVTSQIGFGFDHFYQCNTELWGTKGKITMNRIFTAGPGVTPSVILEKPDGTQQIEVDQADHFVNLLNDFSNKINNGIDERDYNDLLLQARLINDFNSNCIISDK